jgi:glyoxylase-like metal-dependent hydrolase (beta-lactamase superfamily II)
MSDDVHEVYALAYARVDRRSPANFLGGDPHDVPMPLAYYVWLIVAAGGRTIVVDTGFDQRGADLRQRTITRPVGEGLRAFGVDPAAVEDVIVTHLHYDHCGNDGLFPHARYHLQEAEMAFATGRCMGHPVMRASFEVEDVVAMVRRVYAGRVVFHDGAAEIVPGVSVHHIGGHSRGLQAVRVKTRRGHVVLASDVVHFYAHLDQRRPYPVIDSVAAMLAGFDTVERLASSRDHVVPGHDPLVKALYPAARPGSEDWALRLDAEPKPR